MKWKGVKKIGAIMENERKKRNWEMRKRFGEIENMRTAMIKHIHFYKRFIRFLFFWHLFFYDIK